MTQSVRHMGIYTIIGTLNPPKDKITRHGDMKKASYMPNPQVLNKCPIFGRGDSKPKALQKVVSDDFFNNIRAKWLLLCLVGSNQVNGWDDAMICVEL